MLPLRARPAETAPTKIGARLPRHGPGFPLAVLLLTVLLPTATLAQESEPALLDTWGTTGTGPGQWVDPLRLAATDPWSASGEHVLVVDRASGRVQRYGPTGNLVTEWDAATTAMVDPVAVAWKSEWGSGTQEEILVLDAGLDAVLVFDPSGAPLRQFPVTAFEDGDVDVDPDAEQVHVLLSDRHVLETYTLTGVFLRRRGTVDAPGSSVESFDTPRGMALLWDERKLAVADTGNDRVKVFDLFGDTVHAFGAPGSGPGEFSAPLGVGFDCRSGLVVADTGNDRVQRLSVDFSGAVSFDEVWFDPPAGGLSRVVDLAYPLAQGFIVGKDEEAAKRAAYAGDLFLLDAGAGLVRRYEPPCCPSGFPYGTAASAGGDLLITPAGTGPSLAEVGATIEVSLFAGCPDAPIANYPFQDIWLDDAGSGDIALCRGGSLADANTDRDGRTTISGAIAGGGSTDAGMQVYVAGTPVDSPPLAIRVSSPDRNADLSVNLADVGEFGLDYTSQTVALRNDFNFDVLLNLVDVAILAQHLGEICP